MRSLQNSQVKLKETSEHHGMLLTEIIQCLGNLLHVESPSGYSHNSETGYSFGNNGGIVTLTMKLDFPRFDGKNPTGWQFKAKQYFSYHNVPATQWLIIASLNLEGEALEWY